MTTKRFFLALVLAIWLVPGTGTAHGGSFSKQIHHEQFTPTGPTPMVGFCFPGVGGITTCPCMNWPASVGVGCDNATSPSVGTGGAYLDSSGIASTTTDSLSLEVYSTLPTLHTVFVGTTNTSPGIRFGAGIRCVGSPLKILAMGTPTSGPPYSISFTGIYAKSIAAGLTPNVGQTYFYYVGYDNADMNGAPGCPGTTFGFNATNSGAITWI